ncbi:MAG: HAD family hydrolase [Armatimonadota bacterium]|nr:HAD family hydrolase [Armatimonadota bacterium]
MAKLRGVILDIDGTLIDSVDAHAGAWVAALTEAGYDAPFEKVRRGIGMGGDKMPPEVIGVEKESAEGKKLSDRRADIFERQFEPTIPAFPGTRELLERMQRDGLKLLVGTSSGAEQADRLLELAGCTDLVDHMTTSSDAESSKPDPDIVQAALEKGKLSPDEALMIGDTPYDIEAARKAGVRTIAFRSAVWNDEELVGAVAIYDGPADLLTQYESSPLGPSFES